MERIPAAMLKGNGADAEVTNAGGMLVFSSGGIAEVLTALDEYNLQDGGGSGAAAQALWSVRKGIGSDKATGAVYYPDA